MEGSLIASAEDALSFLLAGNATFTLASKRTGVRFTYRARWPEPGSDRRFVSLLSGPDNTSDYLYMGMLTLTLDGRVKDFVQTRASRITPKSVSWFALTWALHHLKRGDMPEELEFWHEGRCGRCGRKLTVPESIARGLGPTCAGA